MTDSLISAALALAAAICIAIGAVLRQRAAAESLPGATLEATPGVLAAAASAHHVLLSRKWWAGTFVGLGGYGFHAAALSFGPLLLVQPLLVTSLLFALPLGARFADRPITRNEWLCALALTAAVAALVALGDPRPGAAHVPSGHWGLLLVIGLPAAAGLVAVATAVSGNLRALILGVVSGALFGVTAVLTKGVLEVAGHGIGAVASAPQPYGLVLCAVAGTVLQHYAYQSGALQASLPGALIAEQVVAIVLAIVSLGETVGGSTLTHTTLILVAVVAAVAAYQLARSSSTPARASG